MTPQENPSTDERAIQTLEEICENTRAIRRVVNRILDLLHEYADQDQDNGIDYDPEELDWKTFSASDDMYY
jgi:hypothetical protein